MEKKAKIKKPGIEEEDNEVLVRIFGCDVPGSKNIYTALTKIKGISWSVSNAVCIKMGIPKTKKVSEFSNEEIAKIEEFLRKMPIADYLKNKV